VAPPTPSGLPKGDGSGLNDLKYGFVAPGDLRQVAALESWPIDSLWVGGHVASPNPSPEALVGLARLSAVTERVSIGTSILLLPLYPPAIVAKQVADLDRVSGGRVILGIGVGGEYPQEFRACGVPVGERGSRSDEAIPLLRSLWSGEVISHHGLYFPMTDVKIHPPPAQPGGPPIVVAGRKDPAMRRAALLGDGWMPYLYSPRRYASSVARIRQIADDAGRDLRLFEWYAFIFVNTDQDGHRARREAATMMGGTYDQDFAQMVDNVAAAGTPDEVLERIVQYVAAGARHFVFLPATTRPGGFDSIARSLTEDIMPRVRARTAR
jgi:probable F420-dependent oxidoreductase